MAATQSNRRRRKPRKPYSSFPLTAHNNGQWCKKIRGRVHFFGKCPPHNKADYEDGIATGALPGKLIRGPQSDPRV